MFPRAWPGENGSILWLVVFFFLKFAHSCFVLDSGKTYTPEKAAQRTASEIDKMPIAELRALCDDMELSSKGTKKDLQMRLREYFKC